MFARASSANAAKMQPLAAARPSGTNRGRSSAARPARPIYQNRRRIPVPLGASTPAAGDLGKDDFRSRSGEATADELSEITTPEECRIAFFGDGSEMKQVMCGDYGFRSGTGKIYEETDGKIPGNIWQLATDNFKKEVDAMKIAMGRKHSPKAPAHTDFLRQQLNKLELDDEACWRLEQMRDEERGKNFAPWFIKTPFYALCFMTDNLFKGRPIQRFWFLEEVARMPYMAYIAMMHLYETLGWFRASAPVRKVHFAEEWNEMHHLMIMESLGGDQSWGDRFLAQHAAVFYFSLLCVFYAVSPQIAYKFSCLVEGHAVDTYDQFARQNKELLETLPPPYCAVAYYLGSDVYMLDAFTVTTATPRRPKCDNLYDVFVNIRDDEVEHEGTMQSCQENELPKLLADLEEKRGLGKQ